MKLSESIQQRLACPVTGGKLRKVDDSLQNIADPKICYPIVNGIPILINSENSIFSVSDFTEKRNTTFDLKRGKIRRAINFLTPEIHANIKAKKNYTKLSNLLPENSKILVIGGSIKGEGMDAIYSNNSFEIIGTDVSFGPYTKLIVDAHDIPFEDETFDCIIIQAVLEHVLDPQRCVSECHRVLKPSGLIYAETPFMQQVHMKQYDFTRFTYLGHRRLFRHFKEVDSGSSGGPGSALAWSYKYFLRSWTTSPTLSKFLAVFAHFTSFYLKYFDYYLIDKPGAYDAASAFYFLGEKSDTYLSDKDLLLQFQGIK